MTTSVKEKEINWDLGIEEEKVRDITLELDTSAVQDTQEIIIGKLYSSTIQKFVQLHWLWFLLLE